MKLAYQQPQNPSVRDQEINEFKSLKTRWLSAKFAVGI